MFVTQTYFLETGIDNRPEAVYAGGRYGVEAICITTRNLRREGQWLPPPRRTARNILVIQNIPSTRRGLSRPVDRFARLAPTAAGSLVDLPPCWWATAELRPWWEREVANMAMGYPSFISVVRRRHRDLGRIIAAVASVSGHDELRQDESERERIEREECGEFVLAWRGTITPFPIGTPFEELQAIVTDLDEDRPVRVMADGVIGHYTGCGGSHTPRPELRLGRTLHGGFQIEMAYRRPPGCPIARSIWPRINKDHPRGPPPHLLNNIDALCVLFPADGNWVWDAHGARVYANYTAIWLAKHLAWVEARERNVGIDKAWPGSFVGHDPAELPRLLRPHDPCRCGSGRKYADCCAGKDATARILAPFRP